MLYWSPGAKRSWANVENLKLVELGMKSSKVLQIMGRPDEILIASDESEKEIYYYSPPFMASDGIFIEMSHNETVDRIIGYE